MTVYIDDMHRPARVGRTSGRWSHLFTDQDDQTELHEFAARLGLSRVWFQGERWQATHPWRCHYDVVDSVRGRALALGATPIDYPGGVAALIEQRKTARRANELPDGPGAMPRPGPSGHQPVPAKGRT